MVREKPTAECPLLVGVLADVSASMLESMGSGSSRLESFRDSLHDLADRARELSAEPDGERMATLVRLFAYGFGFGNLLSIFMGDSRSQVRDLLELENGEHSTVPLDDIARDWHEYERHLERLAHSMAGGTPMLSGFDAVRRRFERERSTSKYTADPVLFVLSDGMPSEGSGTPEEIVNAARDIEGSGVTIVSCYVTDADLAEPRRLYGRPPESWPEGAKLMFECASELPRSSEFERYLSEYEWKIEDHARLFTQINQSEILSEFLNLVLSPLRASEESSPARVSSAERGRVFVSYSHRDSRWLERLQVYLRPLERENLIDVWADSRIAPGEDWSVQISAALETASVAVLLVTADFLASDFIATEELPRLLEAAHRRGLTVIPVIVGASDFNSTPLARYQAINSPERPLNGLRGPDRDRVLVELGQRIRALSQRAAKR